MRSRTVRAWTDPVFAAWAVHRLRRLRLRLASTPFERIAINDAARRELQAIEQRHRFRVALGMLTHWRAEAERALVAWQSSAYLAEANDDYLRERANRV